VPDEMMQQNPEVVKSFLKATHRGTAFTTENPDAAFELLCQAKPQLRNELFKKIFIRSLPFFSRTMLNIERDWNKVNRYMQHLKLTNHDFDITTCFTNEYLPLFPHSDLIPIACCV
jgi:ABC-type nitrate/sulfonate/bicarbonate transport system substrate-binding protein